MNNKILLMAVGSALLLSACGQAAPAAAPAATEPPAAVTESTHAADNVAAETPQATEAAAETGESLSEDIPDWNPGKEVQPDANGVIDNGFMSITMPKDLAGTYVALCTDDRIDIYDKESRDADYGGFAFGVCVTEDYGSYGGMMTKVGELTDRDGRLYHVLISLPSDVQWDYTKSEEPPASYKALSDAGRDVIRTLKPDQGGEYVDGGGTKGADIYGDLVKDIIAKIQKCKDSNELEAEDLSPVYYAMTQGANPQDPMKDIGVAYVDINLDGVDEMLVGDIKSRQIYDLYASVDGKPAHVASGHWRDYYMVYTSMLSEYLHEGAGIITINQTVLQPNSTELFPQFSLRDDESDEKNPKYFLSYDVEADEWEELKEDEYKDWLSRIEDNDNSMKYEFTPLGNM